MIYLDSAATAEYSGIDDVIIDTMTNAMKRYWQNPSSLYAADVKNEVNKCRVNIANFIGAKPNEIYFTSGASESNNWAIRGWVDEMNAKGLARKHIITTSIEHKSILSILQSNCLKGCLKGSIFCCNVNEFGMVDCELLKRYLSTCKPDPILVSIHMANNEIGVIQDIKTISELVHKYGGILHVDATQALPYIPINVEKLGIDLLSASGHKISPVLKGVGFLYKKNGINIQPLIHGNQESGLRGGTENVFGIIGLSKAIEYCDVSMQKIDEMCEKRDYFIDILVDGFDCKLNGDGYYRLPNNINITFPQNITGESLLYILDASNIKISTGSACNSKSIEPSYVLKAIGLSDEDAMKTIRITLSDDITYEEIDCVINEIDKAIRVIEI